MKLTNQTIQILKSFSKMSKSIFIPEGNQIRAWNPNTKTIYAIFDTEETFEESFALHDLPQFLQCLQLFYVSKTKEYDVDLTFQESYGVNIVGKGDTSITYALTSFDCVEGADYNRDDSKMTRDVEFLLPADKLKDVLTAASTLGASSIAIVGDKENVYLRTQTDKSSNPNIFSLTVGHTDKKFKLQFDIQNFNFFDSDYDIAVCIEKMKIEVKSTTIPLRYYTVTQAQSR